MTDHALIKAWKCTQALWALGTVMLACMRILLLAPFQSGPVSFRRGSSWCMRHIAWRFGITLDIQGWEQLPADIREGRQPALFMSSHESNLDPPLLLHAIPLNTVFISKKEVLWVPLLGWASWAGGVIFIDRGNRERAKASLKRAARRIREGKNVVIFPEGTRTRDGQLGPFKKGGFALAMDAGVPIVPVATVGGYAIMPAGSCAIHAGTLKVTFCDPVYPSAFESREALMEEVRARILAHRG